MTSHAAELQLSAGYRRYAMVLLMTIYAANFLDRQVINILAESIKTDLGLADWQIGMMSGIAFAMLYSIAGIPIARLAERGHRPRIIATSAAIWTGFTLLCGTVSNFTQLVLYRIGVGVGEAGCTPTAHSLISDYVPIEKRASALSFYSMGIPIGVLLGLGMGGVVADAYGWRMAFVIAGAPGLVLALLAIFTLKEPRLQAGSLAQQRAVTRTTLIQTLSYLAGKRTFRLIVIAAALQSFIAYGQQSFIASFFLRVHGADLASLASQLQLQPTGFLGLALGLANGAIGAVSVLLGGQIADRFARRDLRVYVVLPSFAALVTLPGWIASFSVSSVSLALLIIAANAVLASLWIGPFYAACQSLVPPHMRATTSALILLFINLIGLGLGPLMIGVASDYFAGGMGMGAGEGLRRALILSNIVGVAAAGLFWTARRTIREEVVS